MELWEKGLRTENRKERKNGRLEKWKNEKQKVAGCKLQVTG
jgi:hypothetical protein